MRFIIYQENLRKYFTHNNKVIVFNDEKQAIDFANAFYQYALPIAMQEAFTDPTFIGEIINSANAWKVIELPTNYEFEVIDFEEIKKK